jgi:hypothetical protein
MKSLYFITALSLLSVPLISQNDIDAIRYSQTYFGGTSRSKAMAGAVGAMGADGSCMAVNPAGIGLYKKGDINISFGLRFFSVDATHNGTSNKNFKASVPFDGLSIIGAWDGKQNTENHHAIGLSCSQIANFNSNISIQGSSNHKSMAREMLANAQGQNAANLDGSYEGMGFETYAIDTIYGQTNYYSFVNNKFNMLQSKEIQTAGRINEWNFNYAYGYQDKLYLGAALGIASVNYNYSSVYTEADNNDSMRLNSSYIGTYNDGYCDSVIYYNGFGGFKDLSYQETYKTTGTGYNLKLGAIFRATDYLRIGASFQSPTVYSLTDTYIYKMTTNFDEGGSASSQYPPDNGGKFNYQIITPMKFTGSIAYLYKKLGIISVDYDFINYKQASLQSTPQEFTGANKTIRSKYNSTSNLRVGAEVNVNPFYIRLGYAMYGSPFGDTFSGDFVKSFYTGGLGFRKNKFYVDMSFTRSMSNENYYMYNPNYVDKSTLKNSGTTIALSIGSKF